MLKKFNLLICLISFSLLGHVRCDYSSSVLGLERLLALESYWMTNMENYIKAVEESNNSLREYLESNTELFKVFVAKPTQLYENPLNTLTSIKRIVSDWKIKEKFVVNSKDPEEYARNLAQIQTELNIDLPTRDDLSGAAKGLARLQKTYALKTEDVANGKLLNTTYSSPMTANECFYMGRYLYDTHELAVEWLAEARVRNRKSSHATGFDALLDIEDITILESLGPVFFNSGNFKMAAKINEELLHKHPDNKYGLLNKPIFDNKMFEERQIKLQADYSLTVPSAIIQPLYEGVCSGAIKQSPAERRNLRCRYVSNNVPFCLVAPFKMEELSLDPKIALYHESIYENEIEQIIKFGVEKVERSKVGDLATSDYSDVRSSKNTWIFYDQNSFLNAVSQRLNDISGLSLESAEPLQVATYGIGGHYGPHHDFSEDPNAYGEKGNRIATALFYISEVELGGGTAFPLLRLVVPPVRRSLVLWYNLHESLELDYRTLHAGCPVLKGSKWVCNEWFHERNQEFTKPCSLQMHGNKSVEYKHIHYLS